MEKRRLGKSGYMVSKIGLGTVQFGLDYGFTKRKSQDEVDEILNCADKLGINLIDTARSYGDSEKKIGNYISQNKHNFIIATKLEKLTYDDVEAEERMKSKVLSSINTSLEELKLDHLDILQLHQADEFILSKDGFWDLLFSLKKKGIVRCLGVSVYEENEVVNIIGRYGAIVDFFQIPYNILDKRFEKLKDIFRIKDIGIISRSTFLKGVIACKIKSLPEELIGLSDYKARLEKIAREMNISVADLALLYVYNKDFISSTILGVDSPDELKLNINAVANAQKAERKLEDFMVLLDNMIVDEPYLIDPRRWKGF